MEWKDYIYTYLVKQIHAQLQSQYPCKGIK